jgi:hypothetical protein
VLTENDGIEVMTLMSKVQRVESLTSTGSCDVSAAFLSSPDDVTRMIGTQTKAVRLKKRKQKRVRLSLGFICGDNVAVADALSKDPSSTFVIGSVGGPPSPSVSAERKLPKLSFLLISLATEFC